MKNSSKAFKPVHTAITKKGKPDAYGTGIKNKMGKMKAGTVGMELVSAKKIKMPPKSMA